MKRYLRVIILSLTALFLSGCAMAEPMRSGDHPPVKLSAWMAEWDAKSGQAEFKKWKNRLNAVSCFAVYYDQEDKPYATKELRDLAKQAKKGKDGSIRYLSFVNDSMQKDGSSKEKDTELLKRLLADEESMNTQIERMIALTKELDCSGIELDFEKQWKDEAVGKRYLDFTYLLSSACTKNGLKLRIILEPSAPMDAEFCKGPEYIVMLYNLYGKHSDPGPKADGAFIRKTIKKMESLPGEKAVAIATGGCLWEKEGKIFGSYTKKQFLTEEEAISLQKKYKAEPKRDEESADLFFTYEAKGKSCEVWYADSETLNAWITAAAKEGVSHVAVWRLGGNREIDKVRGDAK